MLLTSEFLNVGLESLNSAERCGKPLELLETKPAARRPMNVTEKIFALHDVTHQGSVSTGDTIRVSVDWIMASEASWHVRRHHSWLLLFPQASSSATKRR